MGFWREIGDYIANNLVQVNSSFCFMFGSSVVSHRSPTVPPSREWLFALSHLSSPFCSWSLCISDMASFSGFF